jgi:class 3 adenylate cyclase/pimeloyl-ACP methyl ester carboxylesterase
MEPQYRYCTSADGTRISFSTLGAGPLRTHVMVDGWAAPQPWAWDDPAARVFYHGIARDRCVVRYDRRGVGASERTLRDLSMDAQVSDVRAIVEELALEEIDLLGVADGTPVAMAFAAQFPDTVRHLMLWSPYARGVEVYERESMRSVAELMRSDWRLGRRTFASLQYPKGPIETQRAYSVMLRDAIAPEVAARYMEFETDVRSVIPSIRAATLVVEHRGAGTAVERAAKEVAAVIPGARRVMPRGGGGDIQGWQEQLQIVKEFLGEHASPAEPAPPGVRTVLFTDIVGHAEMMQRLGDAKGRELLREHERITRELLKQHGGAEVKTMGDGFMASFGSVTSAMECAIALQRAFETHTASMPEPLRVRVGLNAGEPIEEDGDLFGATVILASRIAAKAGAGEILLPETLRHLLSGKSYVYADRGETMLKGFEDAVRLFEVRWRE